MTRTSGAPYIPGDELWLWVNGPALRSVLRGLAQARHGETVDEGSHAHHLDLVIDDNELDR